MDPIQIQPHTEIPEQKSSREGLSGRYARSRTRAASRGARERGGTAQEANLERGARVKEGRTETSRRSHRDRRLRSEDRSGARGKQPERAGQERSTSDTARSQRPSGEFAARLEAKSGAATKAGKEPAKIELANQSHKQEAATFQAPNAQIKPIQHAGRATKAAPVATATSTSVRPSQAVPMDAAKAAGEPTKTRPSAKAPAEAAPMPDRDQASDVLRQVRLQIFPEARTATVHLKPAELGRVSIRLVVDGDQVQAIVRAESPEALAALEQHMPELQASLGDRGFKDAQLDLALGFEGDDTEQLSGSQAVEPSPDQIHRLFANAEGVDFYA